jgi:hypothetical protein
MQHGKWDTNEKYLHVSYAKKTSNQKSKKVPWGFDLTKNTIMSDLIEKPLIAPTNGKNLHMRMTYHVLSDRKQKSE